MSNKYILNNFSIILRRVMYIWCKKKKKKLLLMNYSYKSVLYLCKEIISGIYYKELLVLHSILSIILHAFSKHIIANKQKYIEWHFEKLNFVEHNIKKILIQ